MNKFEIMEDKLSKKFYKIGDVAEILNIPTSTLRFWEKEFSVIKPKRNTKNIRVYTVKDIEIIKMIYYLVKEKGLKLDAAQAMIKRNRDGISKQYEVVERLKQMREQLLQLDKALATIKK
jgi:DNA-binding transcriptional MerR regulator